MSFEKNVGVLLAGGQSRRFGAPKAFTHYKDKAMYQWALEAISPVVHEVIIISHPDLTNRFKFEGNEHVYEDVEEYRGMGPLAGIYTAMVTTPGDWYYIMPCDTPHIQADVFRLLENHLNQGEKKGVVPMFNGKLHPLVSIFHRDLLAVISDHLSKGILRMSDLIEKASIPIVELSDFLQENPFVNFNTKSELNEYEEKQS